jgi:hypothetical protein
VADPLWENDDSSSRSANDETKEPCAMAKTKNVHRKPGANTKRTWRKPEEIRELLQRIEAARTSGSTLAKALQQAGVPYNTYHKWTKKSPQPVSTTPAPSASPRRRGKSADEIRKVLGNIAAARTAGMGLIKTLKEIGLSMSTYKYWLKKHSGKMGAAATGKKSVSLGAKKASVLALLEEMTANRKKRQELASAERQIIDLDDRFAQLRKQLDNQADR